MDGLVRDDSIQQLELDIADSWREGEGERGREGETQMLQSTLKWRQGEIYTQLVCSSILAHWSLSTPPTPLSSHLPHSALPSQLTFVTQWPLPTAPPPPTQLTFVTQWPLPTAPLEPLDNGVSHRAEQRLVNLKRGEGGRGRGRGKREGPREWYRNQYILPLV